MIEGRSGLTSAARRAGLGRDVQVAIQSNVPCLPKRAIMARVERLVFYTFDAAGSAVFERALATTARVANDSAGNTAALVRQVTSMGFEWGFSDGN